LSVAEELVVLVVATVAAADLRVVGDELDPLDPFDLLDAELDLVARSGCFRTARRMRCWASSPRGFLDAWGPVFFFAMIFAISMDYTVFLLSAAKEHWDRTHDPREAMIGGLAHSGRVIFAAGAVMVAVFFTFALSGPLPPKEMGVILGVAVLLDAMLVRLLLLPVLLRLLGRWAWWLPKPLRVWVQGYAGALFFNVCARADRESARRDSV